MGNNLLTNNPFAILTFIAAPAILTNATSVLAMSTINRMLRTRDRMHELFRESENKTQFLGAIFLGQVHRVERQALLLLNALRWIYAALGAFAAASLVTLLGAVAGQLGSEILMRLVIGAGLLLGFIGVAGLVGGCINLFHATQLSLVNIREEAELIRARQGATEVVARKFIAEMNLLWKTDFAIEHTARLARSLKHWTGRELLPGIFSPAGLAQKVFEMSSIVIVSHGIEADPILNYGNRAALTLWEMSWDEFTRTPSRLTAEAPNRGERARLLASVAQRGFIDDYSGVRLSKTGRRFRIMRATVWNLLAGDNKPCGQAAMFKEWEFL